MTNTESWVWFGGSRSLAPCLCRSSPLSWLRWLEWEEGQRVFSGREKRKERQSGDLSKHVGVCSDPLHTDVHAAEAARKQASTRFLPYLVLFFFLFVLFIFVRSLSSCSRVYSVCLSPSFTLSFCVSYSVSPLPFGRLQWNKRGWRNFEQSQPLMSLLD